MRSRPLLRRCVFLAGALAAAQPLLAQTVTTTADSGPGSLRDALDAAAPGAQIGFQLGDVANPVITLPNGAAPLLVGVDGVRIDGTAAPGLAISGSQAMPGDPLPVVLRLDAGGTEDEVTFVDVNQRTGVVELDGTLVYVTNRDTTLAVDIRDLGAGTGSLVKDGSAVLVLSGENDFSGGIEVIQGTLRGPAGSLPGDIENGGTLIFDQPVDDPMSPTPGVYSGLISDRALEGGGSAAGRVTKTGAGELRLDGGAHTYSGGTTVDAGRLVLAPGTSLAPAGALAVGPSGTFVMELDAATSASLTGALSGRGRFELDAADATSVLELGAGGFDGAFAFTGGAATVRDAGGVLRGDVDFGSSGGVLEVRGDASLGGKLSGTGTLRADPAAGGGSTVTLSGTNSHSATEVVSGTLVGNARSLVGAIDNAAALRVSGASGESFTATVSGAGSFEKSGSGSLPIGVDQPYTGATLVSGGSLELQADLTGTPSLFVASGATLTGSGDAPLAALDVEGRLDPFDPLDAIAVQSASFAPGSALRMDVFATGSGDRLVTTGDLDASAAELELRIAQGDYSTPVAVVLLDAGGALGVPAVSDALPFLEVTPFTSGGQFGVEVAEDLAATMNVALFARTPNQRAFADYFQLQLDAAPGTPFDPVRDAFFALPSEGAVRRAFDSMAGESYSALTDATLGASRQLERTLHRRQRGASLASRRALWGGPRGDERLGALPSARPPAARAFAGRSDPDGAAPGPGLWIDLWGGLGHHDGGSASDVDRWGTGLFLGGDAPLGPLQLGAALGTSYADVDLDAADTATRSVAVHAALYASTAGPLGYLSVAGRYVHAYNESEREIALGGFSDAEADFDTDGGGAGLEGGLNLAAWRSLWLQGVASFDWTRLEQESFRESGAGPLDLDVDAERVDSLLGGLGLRLGGAVDVDPQVTLLPELRLRWLHEFGDTDRRVTARFAGAPAGGSFGLSGAEAPRDALLAGLGWTGVVSEALRIHADYDALVDADRVDHRLSVGAQFRFH